MLFDSAWQLRPKLSLERLFSAAHQTSCLHTKTADIKNPQRQLELTTYASAVAVATAILAILYG